MSGDGYFPRRFYLKRNAFLHISTKFFLKKKVYFWQRNQGFSKFENIFKSMLLFAKFAARLIIGNLTRLLLRPNLSRFAAHIVPTMKNPVGFSVLKRVWYLFNQNFPLTIKVYLFAICFLALGQKMVLFATKLPLYSALILNSVFQKACFVFAQCGNFMIFLSLRSYVKSILGILEA